jgi:hypothetical protein
VEQRLKSSPLASLSRNRIADVTCRFHSSTYSWVIRVLGGGLEWILFSRAFLACVKTRHFSLAGPIKARPAFPRVCPTSRIASVQRPGPNWAKARDKSKLSSRCFVGGGLEWIRFGRVLLATVQTRHSSPTAPTTARPSHHKVETQPVASFTGVLYLDRASLHKRSAKGGPPLSGALRRTPRQTNAPKRPFRLPAPRRV